jgi:hypothetical protein
VLFLVCLLVTSYFFLFYGFCLNIKGLKAGNGYVDDTGLPVGHDFAVFWSASKVARNQTPEQAYDLNAINGVMLDAIGTNIPQWAWNYPPTFFLFICPLSLLDYPVSYIAWSSITFMLLALIILLIARIPLAIFLLIGFPAVVYNLFAGQNGFLSAFLLGAGLLMINTCSFGGGIVLSLLLFKPHLTIMIPFALIAGKYWTAFIGFIVGSFGYFLLSLSLFGSNSWFAFLENLPFSFSHWQTDTFWIKMPSLYALARLIGVDSATAAILQLSALLLLIFIVMYAWAQKISFPVKGSLLVICTVLASPYLFHYDLCLLTLLFAWLGKEVIRDIDMHREAVLILCWVGLYLSFFILPEYGLNLTLVFLIMLLMLTWNYARREQREIQKIDSTSIRH